MERLHSIKGEMATLRQKLLAAEARAVLAEQRAEEVISEMCEMAGHHTRHFGI